MSTIAVICTAMVDTNEQKTAKRGKPMEDHYLEKSLMAGWSWLTGDADFKDYDGAWYRHLNGGKYLVIQMNNTSGAGWDDNYMVEVQFTDLSVVPQKAIAKAIKVRGSDNTTLDDAVSVLEALSLYGTMAPLRSWEGNNYRRLLRMAKKYSRLLEKQQNFLPTALDRECNILGATAFDYMIGCPWGTGKKYNER